MKVKVVYSSRVEAQALLAAILSQETGRLKALNINVLPFTERNRLHPVGVIIPKLDYRSMPNLLQELRIASAGSRNKSFLELHPKSLETIICEIDRKYGTNIVKRFDEQKLKLFMADFAKDLEAIFGKSNFTELTIYLSRFGTGTNNAPIIRTPSRLDVCIREGCSISNVVAAVIDSVTHLKKQELRLEPQELRPIRDWFISNTRILTTINKHKLKYMPSTKYMRKDTVSRSNRVDVKYVQSLGLFSETLKFNVKDSEIYFNDRCLVGLTINEKKILLSLISYKNKTVSYDSLLDILEENNKIVTYYAVYKTIERLRKKLESLGVPRNLIKTVPKSGIYLADALF